MTNITAQQFIDIPDHLSDGNLAHEINKIMRNNRLKGLKWLDNINNTERGFKSFKDE